MTNSAKHPKGYRIALLGFGRALFVYLLVRLGAKGISSFLLEAGWYFGLIAATYAGHQPIQAIACARRCRTFIVRDARLRSASLTTGWAW